ncbi:hypothetical protein HDA40_003429 [Hamadaea flava]|uniref:Uncharacterized protein n=1 Tax=Hamadaea flava TaxID=1742688 RepID=A0ABV8LIY0_9ACTN|nr:hypothetical protein [Hamadaea flava]MCP2324922.1 hypothetical protein [Hamadaea flava]
MTYRIRLVCTHGRQPVRGEPDKRNLGWVRLSGTGWVHVTPAVIWCPRCGRNPQMSQERWQAAMPQLRDTGATEIDISALPF